MNGLILRNKYKFIDIKNKTILHLIKMQKEIIELINRLQISNMEASDINEAKNIWIKQY